MNRPSAIRGLIQKLKAAVPDRAPVPANDGPLHKRFLTANPVAYASAVEAAQTYVSKLEVGDVGWLRSKPFDPTPGNPQYFRLMFDLLNILQAMQIPARARVLEIGSGPGWVTEVLLMLGFSVDAIEPSADLMAIAEKRCAALPLHYGLETRPNCTIHGTTLEEIVFEDATFDAILFFDVLHHVVDEKLALDKCFKFLRPGGCVGVVEGAWHPDFKDLEQGLIAEMAKFGTLENPFSTVYLDHLLQEAGFVDIQRFAGVNGFFSEPQLSQPLKNFATSKIAGSNNVTARKPSKEDGEFPNCLNPQFKTNALVQLERGGIDALTRKASLTVAVSNTGETLLDNRTTRVGHITLALRQGLPGSDAFVECMERHLLTEILLPGKTVAMQITYSFPAGASLDHWELDLVAEGAFWFSERGIGVCSVPTLER